jgi:hypothetical protein
MSLLPTATNRQTLTPALNTGTQAGQQAGSAAAKNASSGATGVTATTSTPVSLSQSGLDLSAQGLAARAETLGENTVDFAQNFVSSFTQQFFGDAGKGATISFDSASIESEAGFAAGVAHSQGAGGSTDSAALSINESSHFIGKGTITTADGHTYQFEVEVQYSASAEAAASSSTSSPSSSSSSSPSAAPASDAASTDASAGDTSSLPTLQLPAIDFSGGLSDLFKLLGNKLQADVPAQSDSASGASSADKAGTLQLKLLKLLQQDFKTDPAPATPSKVQSAANAYASQAANADATASPAADPTAAPPATPAAGGDNAIVGSASQDVLPPAA